MNSVKASEHLKETTYQNIISKKSNHTQAKKLLIVIAIVFVCCASAAIGMVYHQTKVIIDIDKVEYSYITIDVNPSMEFTLNKNDQVISATAYNAEAEDILKNLLYENQVYQKVLQELMNNDQYKEYLSDDANIQISIYSKDIQKCSELEKNIDLFMKTNNMSEHYESICIDEQIHHQAEECHVSSGRYILIRDIIDFNSSYTIEELEDKSITELKELYKVLTNQDYSFESWHHHDGHHH